MVLSIIFCKGYVIQPDICDAILNKLFLSVYKFLYQLFLWLCLSMYLSIYPSCYLSVYSFLSLCLSVCLSVCLCLNPSFISKETGRGLHWRKSFSSSLSVGEGLFPEFPGISCEDIRKLTHAKENGEYWIDPKATGHPFKVYCDMTTDGGKFCPLRKRSLLFQDG